MKYLLDANVVMHLANKAEGHRRIASKLGSLKTHERAISAVAAFELRRKIAVPKVDKHLVNNLAQYMAHFEALPFTGRAAERAAEVYRDLSRRHIRIQDADVMQAGHALALGRVFVTADRHFGHVAGLAVQNWARPGATT